MKLHYKSVVLLALALGVASCQEDEVLNLEQFHENQPHITIDDNEGNSTATILATYQGDGSLALDGKVTRNYTFNFAASPEDANVHFDIINSNIPADKVSISTEDVMLPAGFGTAGVTVTLANEDFSFATENYEEATYELGVKATVKGYKIGQEPIESKVIIKKEAYSAACYVKPIEEEPTSYIRTYAIGKNVIMEDEPIVHKFLMKLDKPARKDVKVKISTKGIKEAYGKDVTVTPAEILIKAGEVSSETISWTINNNFLLEDDKPATFELALTANIECEDPVVYLDEEKNSILLEVDKRIRNLGPVDVANIDWKSFTKTNWGIVEKAQYMANPKDLIDGNSKTGQMAWISTLQFEVDMKEIKSCKGFGIDYLPNPYYWGPGEPGPAAARNVMISTSTDNKTWTDQGVVAMKEVSSQYIECFAPIDAQYVRFTLIDSYAGFLMYVSEVYVYGD